MSIILYAGKRSDSQFPRLLPLLKSNVRPLKHSPLASLFEETTEIRKIWIYIVNRNVKSYTLV